MKNSDKEKVRRYVESKYAYAKAFNCIIRRDGSVSVFVNAMPNTNQPGRIFVGWDTDLLKEANEATKS